MSSEPGSNTSSSKFYTGGSSTTPPAALPLTFFGASFAGLIACGLALVLAHNQGVADPTSDPLVAAAHFGMLATLSMGILGALHQFTPVVTQRPLRSVRLGWTTFVAWLLASWLLPLGFGTRHEVMVEAGGAFAAIAITLLTINLWNSLKAKGKGAPVLGLRFALSGFIATGCFGVVYVADRRGNWFDLSGHVVLAHASIGLLAWLGLTYVSVAEKLWPMFFLAHVPGKHHPGIVAVVALPMGVLLLSPGLLLGLPLLAWIGGAVILLGLTSHISSLTLHLLHRKRPVDLYFIFVATSAIWMVMGVVFALLAGIDISRNYHLAVMMSAASAAAFGGWILEAFVGHIHKVIPFVQWSMFRRRGIQKNLSGNQLMFGDLYNHWIAAIVYGTITIAIAAICAGLAISIPGCLVVGGTLFALAGVLLPINFSVKSIHILRTYAAKTQAQ